MTKYTSDKCIFRLATYKISEFRTDLTKLALELPTWMDTTLKATGCSQLSGQTQGKLKVLAFQLLWRQAPALDHRIFQRLEQCLDICDICSYFFCFDILLM